MAFCYGVFFNGGVIVATKEPVKRTRAGLRDALFDEIDALRDGSSNAARARAVAMLANSVLQSVTAEIEQDWPLRMSW